MPGALSFKTKPSGVISSTASSVTTFFTQCTPVSGSVTGNDNQIDCPDADYSLLTGPANGTVSIDTNGNYTYTPNANFNGTDQFTYVVCDGGTPNLCDTANVTINVTAVNDPPVAVNDNYTTNEDI
ncbi:MAG TPA: cadherin-like domain-containing protein, partial [Chitinophagaceae bacterium]|nr:cadherin-like domain-containing protein [Chitinophagaceae bacterium]